MVKKIKKKAVQKSKKKVVKKKSPAKKIPKVKKRISVKHSKRVQTWIPNLDKLIGGGFENGSTNLLVGGSGSGKSIFATQFLVEAMKRGEKCLYVTFEEKKAQFYENMLSLGWDLAEYEKKDLFTFLEYTPIKVKTMLDEGGGAIESIILKKKITRMVMDSITSFALLFENELSQREAALSLFSMIHGWNCTSLLTLEEDPLDHTQETSRSLEFEVDSIIMLYFIREPKERQRYLEVLKIRGTDHSKKIFPFDIIKKGISIRSKPVSKTFA
jgi:KaiC/GvpD/RAD55 family RecA-like ATPase